MSQASVPFIRLAPLEDAFCQLLDDTCRWIKDTRPQPDPSESGGVVINYSDDWNCEARIAGGWVRDKLLGLASHDLDIALSSLTGHTFALLLRGYLLSVEFSSSTLAVKPDSPFYMDSTSSNKLVGHITRIDANPEQSKNLETATARVAGLQLDFVNLRKETYIGNSRIPTMTFGTALEDAQRRDTTVNALFYNVHTRRVEDMTRFGLSDLREGIIRTPLEPSRTFLDDPLRVLRCVRFASRFGYTVDQKIVDCMRGSDGDAIRQALQSKVSRERFGIEVDKMMLGPNPKRALDLIHQLKLYDVVFGPPPNEKCSGKSPVAIPTIHDVQKAMKLIDDLWTEARRRQSGQTSDEISLFSNFPDELLAPALEPNMRRLLFYSAALLPLKDIEWEKKRKLFWAGECVVAEGLKLGVKNTREPLTNLHRAAQILHRPYEHVFREDDSDYRGRYVPNLHTSRISPRSTRGLLLRLPEISKAELGLSAELSILWALIADLSLLEGEQPMNALAIVYRDFFLTLHDEKVLSRTAEKPVLDGKEACSILGIGPGKLVMKILKGIEAWQLDRDPLPENCSEKDILLRKEQCAEWLQTEWGAGRIVPLDQR